MDQPFDLHYQKYFIAHCLRDSDFLLNVLEDLDPNIFSNDAYKRVIRLCIDFGRDNKAAPDTLAFRYLDNLKAKGLLHENLHQVISNTIDELFTVPLQNREYLRKQYDAFLRQQKAKSILIPFMDCIKKEEFDKAEELMKDLFQYRPSQVVDLGGFLSADPTERISRRRQEESIRLWTLVPELDSRIDGLRPGELGVFQSQRSSAGKSAALQFLARSFAFQGKRVLIYTLEMSREAYEDRLDQCIAGITKGALTDRHRIQKALTHMLNQGGGIWVKHLPAELTTVGTLRKYTDMIANVHNFHPDAVIIDYADLLGPETKELRGDLYASGREVYSNLASWIQEDKLVCWTAAQSQRGAGEELVADMHHMGGSIAKAQIAHLIISLNRTQAEEQSGHTRLGIQKNREGAARYTITIPTDFERMQWWTRGSE
jgi:replicative DNA helicase